jgi:hypothetical protein
MLLRSFLTTLDCVLFSAVFPFLPRSIYLFDQGTEGKKGRGGKGGGEEGQEGHSSRLPLFGPIFAMRLGALEARQLLTCVSVSPATSTVPSTLGHSGDIVGQ